MNSTPSLLEQLIECGTPAHLIAEVAMLIARLDLVIDELEVEQTHRQKEARMLKATVIHALIAAGASPGMIVAAIKADQADEVLEQEIPDPRKLS